MPPLALSDDQLDTLRRFAEPLHPSLRGSFLNRVVAILGDREIGPGTLHRAAEQAQLEYRRPADSLDGRGGKHGR